jgi:hypothetical protein
MFSAMGEHELTTAEAGTRLGRPERTIRLWCKQGRFEGARVMTTPRGDYWLIPESALKTFQVPPLGRPKNHPTPITGGSEEKAA